PVIMQGTGNMVVTINAPVARMGGPISGSGDLIKAGAGVLNLQGVNTYAGDTFITTGTLSATSDFRFGGFSSAATTKLVISAGANFQTNDYTVVKGLQGNG